MDPKALSERDTCSKFPTAAIPGTGWDLHAQLREEYPLTKGRIIVRGKLVSRARTPKRTDYVLFWKPRIPIAVIGGKDDNNAIDDSMQRRSIIGAELRVVALHTQGFGCLQCSFVGR